MNTKKRRELETSLTWRVKRILLSLYLYLFSLLLPLSISFSLFPPLMFQKPHMSSLSVCYSSLTLSHSLSFECYSPQFLLSLKAIFLFLPVSLPSFLSLCFFSLVSLSLSLCFFSLVSLSLSLYVSSLLFLSPPCPLTHCMQHFLCLYPLVKIDLILSGWKEEDSLSSFLLLFPPSLSIFFFLSRFLPFSLRWTRREEEKLRERKRGQ